MSLNGWLQIFVFIIAVLLLARPMGSYMTRVFERRKTFLDPLLLPCERLLYRLTGVKPEQEMRWTEYAVAMLVFSAATLLPTYVLQRVQHLLPLNPQHLPGVEPVLALNTAISFTTNTNWQSYTPETTMSYLTQMLGLATHNFWSAAVGMALAVAFVRGIARRESKTLGNFWVDLTRGILWILLPISIVFSLALVSQGVVQNFKPYDTAKLVEPQKVTGADGKTTLVIKQTIAQGPVASQEAIKMLGTNGGGFFNANSAHPFENPTPLFKLPADALHLSSARGACDHAWPDGGLAEAWLGRARRNGCAVVCRDNGLLLGGVAAEPAAARRRSTRICHAAGRQHGRQGGALRHRQLSAFRHRHHRCKLRRREQHARQLHAARGHGADGQHPARRDCLRRRRLRGSTACSCS